MYTKSDVLMQVLSSLAASISLLENGGKNAAGSDKMFSQMIEDYKKALNNGKNLLNDEHFNVIELPKRIGGKFSWQDGPYMFADEVIEAIKKAGYEIK